VNMYHLLGDKTEKRPLFSTSNVKHRNPNIIREVSKTN
jgi:hypothetical protein